MCGLSRDKLLKAIPAMVHGDTLLYSSNHVKYCTSHKTATSELRSRYNNTDKCARIVTEQQPLCLTEEFVKNFDQSEHGVLRKLVSKLMCLQKQLDSIYYRNRFLRHRLVSAVALPSI